MTSSVELFCTLCRDDNVDSVASVWCTDCSSFLCTDCARHHQRSRLSKHHRTMSAQDYQQLPQFMKDISTNCQEHDRRYEMYCSFHDCACCVRCVTEHSKCKELKELSEVLGNVKTSASMTMLENDLKTLTKHIEKIAKRAHDQTNSLLKQKNQGLEGIKNMRQKINNHLDHMEDDLIKKLELEHTKLMSRLEALSSQIEDKGKLINDMQDELTKMNNFATDLQVFNGIRLLGKKTELEFASIKDLEVITNICETKVQVAFESNISFMTENVKSFGDILIETVPSTVKSEVKQGRAQTNISAVRPVMRKTLSIKGTEYQSLITGCEVLPGGDFLFTEPYKWTLTHLNAEGVKVAGLLVPSTQCLFDVCHLKDDMIAISFSNESEIVLYDMKKKETVKSARLGGGEKYIGCDGVSFVVGQLPEVFEQHKNVHVHVLGIDMSFRAKFELNTKAVNGIAVSNNKIVYTVCTDNTVNCASLNGDTLWSIKNPSINTPSGIALDMDGHSYVACHNDNTVVKIHPDGVSAKVILSNEVGLKFPLAVSIQREKKQFLVCNRDNGYAFLFQL